MKKEIKQKLKVRLILRVTNVSLEFNFRNSA